MASKKILIIDDELDIIKIVVYRLRAKRYEVWTALTGPQGIEMAKAHKPDLIFLDYRLPDFEAEEIATQIRATEGNKHIPIVLFTASVEKIADKVKACGAVDYIIKPVAPEILYAKVAKQIGV